MRQRDTPNSGEADRKPSQRIADGLRARISAGDLAPGSRLPSERQLAAEHDAARNTVREAIRTLAMEGLVRAEHGRGVFVRERTGVIRLGSDRYSPKHRDSGLSPFLLECQRLGKTGRFEVQAIDRIPAPDDIALRLQGGAEEEAAGDVIRRENVFYADDDPVYRVTTFVPAALAEGTDLLQPEIEHPYGIHGVFEARGHVMTRQRDEIAARMPTPDERTRLQIPPGVPVIELLHTSLDQDGEPYEVTRFVMRADLSTLIYDIPIE